MNGVSRQLAGTDHLKVLTLFNSLLFSFALQCKENKIYIDICPFIPFFFLNFRSSTFV